jgi:prevent-host-death family protein
MSESNTVIGAFEAKTRLGELLERVSHGRSYTITKHDRPVARLIGFDEHLAARRLATAAAMRTQRQTYTLGGHDPRALREEGRA